MTNEELKLEIISLIRDSKDEWMGKDWEGHSMIYLGKIADALIAAGLRFGENLTATFDHMALEREHELERRLAEAEHRAEVTEKKYRIALTNYAKLHREATRYNKMTATYDAEITKQAEEELKRESRKDEQS